MTDARHWWRASGALERFIGDLIDAEARTMRPGGPWPPRVTPTEFAAAALGEGGLGFDSLERIGMAAALSEALHLHRGGLPDTLLTALTLGDWLTATAAALERFSDVVTVRSSGSTGPRRSHPHPTDRLASEARLWCAALPGRLRVRSAVASHPIYGLLFTQMLPAEMNLPVDDLRPTSPGGAVGTLRPGDLVIGHPLFWAALLRAAPDGWPPDVIGVTSGAPCPEETFLGLRRAGLARLVDVYGSSETGGIGWRDEFGPYRLSAPWRREDDGRLSQPGRPAVTPPDRLVSEEDGRFRLGERLDGVVSIGGVNVDLGRVRAVLRDYPGVADAAVRPMRAEEGTRLKAFLVPRDDGADLDALRSSLARHADAVLTAPERPRAYRFGRALPRTATGKPGDWEV